jgi:CRP-like cAMP-binding protein
VNSSLSDPVVRKLEFAAQLSEDDRRTLHELVSEVRAFGPREDIIPEGARPNEVHAVLEGYACRYKMLADGSRQIMAWLVPGDMCDLHVSILGEMDHGIATLSACRIGFIPREAVEALTEQGGRLNRALWWATLVDEAVLREWMVGMGRRPADKQIAHLFCELRLRLRSVGLVSDATFELPVTQEEMADTVGMTPVHVNRVLQQLRQAGLIALKGKALTILDVERLEAFADFDPNYLHLQKRRAPGEA